MYVILIVRGKDIRLPRRFDHIDDEAYRYAELKKLEYEASSFRFER